MPRPIPRNAEHARRMGVQWRGKDGLTWMERRYGVIDIVPVVVIEALECDDEEALKPDERSESGLVESERGSSSPRQGGVKRSHEAVSDEEEGDDECEAESDSVSAGKTCRYCGKVFSRVSHRRVHERTVHLGRKDWPCNQCSLKFGYKSSRDQHVRVVHLGRKNWQCYQCGQKFGQRGHRNQHERVVCIGVKDFECERCGKKFGHRCNMKRHMNSSACQEEDRSESDISAGETCRYCGKVFSAVHKRRVHEKTLHLGRKDWPCGQCGKKFAQKPHRDKHERAVCMGVKDFECERCGKKFGYKDSRDKHELVVCMGVKDFECERCGRKYGMRQTLKRHMKSSACQQSANQP